MKKFLEEFKGFALRGNVLDLAVGVIIGAAFQAIVNSLVGDIVSPLIGLIAGNDFSDLQVLVGQGQVAVKYGAFITAVINFIIMAFVIFVLVKGINKLGGIGKKKEEAESTTKECPYCCAEIPVKASRCPQCTSQLQEEKA